MDRESACCLVEERKIEFNGKKDRREKANVGRKKYIRGGRGCTMKEEQGQSMAKGGEKEETLS